MTDSDPADVADLVPPSPPSLTPAAARRQAQDWSLVLSAEGIAHELRGPQLRVRESERERALLALASYERERRGAAQPPSPRVEYGPTSVGLLLAAALPAAFAFVQHSELAWLQRGRADAEAILAGELWRTVTALTLHADAAHVFGNTLACALFGSALLRAVGPGLGSALLLLSGAAANALNAWLHGFDHASVGASSAIFGGIGALAGLQFAERWRWRPRRRHAWLPIAAGLGLLAMLGTGGERTDILAHGLGLLVGLPLGAAVGFGLRRPPRPAIQHALLAASLAAVLAAWTWAFAAA
jgi:rhomboid protease GluP